VIRCQTVVRLAIAGRAALIDAAIVALGAILIVALAACAVAPSASTASPVTAAPATATPTLVVASASDAPPGAPPDAFLTVDPMPRVRGALGTYTWLGTGSDSPWLPGTPVVLPAGRTARVVLEPPIEPVTWRMRKGAADGSGIAALASGSGSRIEFTVPRGATTVALEVDFGATGSAAWFWAVTPAP
jgi:hypothetical protein